MSARKIIKIQSTAPLPCIQSVAYIWNHSHAPSEPLVALLPSSSTLFLNSEASWAITVIRLHTVMCYLYARVALCFGVLQRCQKCDKLGVRLILTSPSCHFLTCRLQFPYLLTFLKWQPSLYSNCLSRSSCRSLLAWSRLPSFFGSAGIKHSSQGSVSGTCVTCGHSPHFVGESWMGVSDPVAAWLANEAYWWFVPSPATDDRVRLISRTTSVPLYVYEMVDVFYMVTFFCYEMLLWNCLSLALYCVRKK